LMSWHQPPSDIDFPLMVKAVKMGLAICSLKYACGSSIQRQQEILREVVLAENPVADVF
jgi:hypothetical protein